MPVAVPTRGPLDCKDHLTVEVAVEPEINKIIRLICRLTFAVPYVNQDADI